MRPHSGWTSLRYCVVSSTPQRGLDASSGYTLSLMSVTVSPDRSSLPLKRKETLLIMALVAELHAYSGMDQLLPGLNRMDSTPSCCWGAPYMSPQAVAKLVMFA